MPKPPSPFAIANVRLFILFRILFNSRFYYPVFTILFLDYGLTIEQFSLLNTVWAITIFCAEVPTGALADIIGRKRLVVATSFLMVAEMALICFVPLGNGTLIFSVFLVNRILSGLAEAFASGADEAIAYDSLAAEGDAGDWPRVLSVQMRLRSVAAVVSMAVGALIYDPAMVNRLLAWVGAGLQVDQQTTMRFPIFLTLLLAIAACIVTLRIREVATTEPPSHSGDILRLIAATGRMTLAAGRWVARTPFALAVIVFGMVYDHILRLVVTLTSQYFRLIGLPEASFGLIGAGMSLLGVVSPKVAEWMVDHLSPAANVLGLTLLTLIALSATAAFFPYLGLLPIALIFFLMMLESFFSSHYLNRITPSSQRATVLSFRGMAVNLAYGLIGVLFAVLVDQLRHRGADLAAGRPPLPPADAAFIGAIGWLPWYALAVLVPIIAVFDLRLRHSAEIHRTG